MRTTYISVASLRLTGCAAAVLALSACDVTGSIAIGDKDYETGNPDGDGDTDTDTDTDSDGDTDTDTDSDADTDVEEPIPDLTVDCNGTGDYETIQEAINAAVSPADIALQPCTYYERIDFLGKDVNVYGIEGSARTTIDGSSGGTLVDVEVRETGHTRLAGVTLTGGLDEAGGAALEIAGSSIELHDIVIEGNRGLNMVQSNIANVDMIDVVISGNEYVDAGSAIWQEGGNLNVSYAVIDCDDAAQGIWHHVQMVLADSEVVCDAGYAVHDYHGEDYVLRSRLYGGISAYYAYDNENTPEEPDSPSERFYAETSVFAGGSIGADIRYMTLAVANSVFYGADSALSMTGVSPSSVVTSSVFADSACGVTADQAATVTYSAFWGNTADGCGLTVRPVVTDDPEFANWPNDLSLSPGSPLIDAGNPDNAYDDTDGSRNDIGIYGGSLPFAL